MKPRGPEGGGTGSSSTTPRRAIRLDVAVNEIAAFVVLAEEGNFTRAGQRLHLSQPGMSARIARLERAVGQRLVDRTTRRVELTPQGRRFLAGATAALGALDAALAPPPCPHPHAEPTDEPAAARPPSPAGRPAPRIGR